METPSFRSPSEAAFEAFEALVRDDALLETEDKSGVLADVRSDDPAKLLSLQAAMAAKARHENKDIKDK
ncbi:MAG: hypothetical protein B7X04_01575 [Parcubacteria group bacterium 21-54-25]|nr:MAG: hypothetical protein B7X04_01575 [Parcubacteria group bacterium 21-54-25]HQU07614.1 hypothetical protein [Candidatus Paceibacterota bacterium]